MSDRRFCDHEMFAVSCDICALTARVKELEALLKAMVDAEGKSSLIRSWAANAARALLTQPTKETTDDDCIENEKLHKAVLKADRYLALGSPNLAHETLRAALSASQPAPEKKDKLSDFSVADFEEQEPRT